MEAAEAPQANATTDGATLDSTASSASSTLRPSSTSRNRVSIADMDKRPSSTPSTRSSFQVPAYYGNRSHTGGRLKPSASDLLWAKKPALASAMHAAQLMHFQALPQKDNPTCVEGAMQRWPHASCGGAPEPLDDRRHAYNFGSRQLRFPRPWALEIAKAKESQKLEAQAQAQAQAPEDDGAKTVEGTEQLGAVRPPDIDTFSMESPKTRAGSPPKCSELLQDFATVLISKYPNTKAAFTACDDNCNGSLTMTEFVGGAKKMRFGGDLKAVFKELDVDRNGRITEKEFKALRDMARESGFVNAGRTVKTRKDDVMARRARKGFAEPAPHARGECLATMHINRPHGERVSTSAGFYSFARSSTGRLDQLLHPYELPGLDPESFSAEHGPGWLQKGIESFSETGCLDHPLRGSKKKLGTVLGRTDRFRYKIPSRGVREDDECRDASFSTQEGRTATIPYSHNGTGASSMAAKGARVGKTFGNMDSCGMLAPKPIGTWAETRMGVAQMSKSMSSFLSAKV